MGARSRAHTRAHAHTDTHHPSEVTVSAPGEGAALVGEAKEQLPVVAAPDVGEQLALQEDVQSIDVVLRHLERGSKEVHAYMQKSPLRGSSFDKLNRA